MEKETASFQIHQQRNPSAKKRNRLLQQLTKIAIKTQQRNKVCPLHFPSEAPKGKDLQEFCESSPSTNMSRFLIKAIMKKIDSRGLESKYPTLIKGLLSEARDEFAEITRQSSIQVKLKKEKIFHIEPYKYLGRTENYKHFLATRKELKKKFVLHQPLIRKILKECVTNLPRELFNLNKVLNKQMEVDEFRKELYEIATVSNQILDELHRNIVKFLEKDKLKNVFCLSSYLGACTGVLSVHMSDSMANSLLNIVNFLKLNTQPYLKMNVSFDKGLILHPESEEIITIYKEFTNKIIDSAKQFNSLEKYKIKELGDKKMFLCLTVEFLESITAEITNCINSNYQPILQFLDNIQKDFSDCYQDLCSGGERVPKSDLEFQTASKQIRFYRNFLPKVMFIPNNTYFDLGNVILVQYRDTLKGILLKIIEELFTGLSAQHEWEVEDICETFQMIETRARLMPITTEELVETGNYMAWVKNEYLDQLSERLYNILEKLAQLLQLGPLQEHHIIRNSEAINWLEKIIPILEENANESEQLKFDAEEKLQKAVEDISIYINEIYPLLGILDLMDDIAKAGDYLKSIALHMVKMKEIEKKIDWINYEEVALNFPKTTYSEYEELKNYIYPFYHLLKLCLDVKRNLYVWLDGSLDLIDREKTISKVKEFQTELLSLQKLYRAKIRQAQDENLSLRFKGVMDDPDLLNWPAPLKLCATALKEIQEFEPNLTVVKIMCNDALRPRHWDKMSKIATFDITPNAGTTLRKMLKLDLKNNLKEYDSISNAASKEQELKENLEFMRDEWDNINFQSEIVENFLLLMKLEDIECVIEDQIFTITAMQNSIYIEPYKSEVCQFYENLIKIRETVHELLELQPNILEISPIFLCEDTAKRLPRENEIFKEVLNNHNSIMSAISSESNVFLVVNNTHILHNLRESSQKFDNIHKGIRHFISSLSEEFATLYFLTNREIITILACNTEADNINKHINRIFPSIKSVVFSEDGFIKAIKGDQEETVFLKETVNVNNFNGCVHKWLKFLENEVRNTVQAGIISSLDAYDDNKLKEWVKNNHSQITIVVTNIIFTSYTQNALKNNSLKEYLSKIISQFDLLSKENKNRPLLVLMAYHRDILTNLINSQVTSDKDFKWLVQLRFYLIENDCRVYFLHNATNYKCEYFGPSDQIIMTPTTEKSFHSLFLAFHNSFHACFEGPAGAGKKETLKGLAKALGIRPIYLNFTRSMNFEIVLNFIKGIISSGSWLCMENCERFGADFSAILSEELMKMSMAVRRNFHNMFFGEQLPGGNCFICFNFQESHYKLPQRLKSSFRPIFIAAPDIEIIVQISLLVSGFQDYKKLGIRIVTFHKLLKELLPEKEFLFDVRILKNVMKNCCQDLAEDEDNIICKSIRKIYLPGLNYAEIKLFDTVLEQIFPLVKSSRTTSDIQNYLGTYKKLGLCLTDLHLTKVMQFEEMLEYKKGIVLLGETFTGKTTLMDIVKSTQENVDITILKHNSMDSKLFWGEMIEQNWSDGIFSMIIRNQNEKKHWIVLDGPANPNFTDFLTTALEFDSKITLASGEVLTVQPQISLIFECEDFKTASPSMISRCGIIYLESDSVAWTSLLNSWLEHEANLWSKDYKENIRTILHWIVPPCLDYISKHLSQTCPMNEINLFKTMLDFFQMIMTEAYESSTKKEDEMKNLQAWIQASIIQSAFWGLACCLDSTSRIKFDEFFKQLWKGQSENHPYPSNLEKIDVSPPPEGVLWDYIYFYKMKGAWKFISDTLKNEKIEECLYLNRILIPTTDTLKLSFLLNLHAKHKHPILFIGPQQIGKTTLIHDFLLNKLNNRSYESVKLSFPENSTSKNCQKLLFNRLRKTKVSIYGPAYGEKMILFIDDLNSGSEQNLHLEMIRGLMDDHSCFNFETKKRVFLENVNFVAAATSNSSSKFSQRFLRHFNTFTLEEPQNENLVRIYSNMLMTLFKKSGFPSDAQAIANQIVSATIDIFRKMSLELKPTPKNIYYKFYTNNMTTIIQVCSMIKKEAADANKKLFARLWTHEVYRVFGDRISNDGREVLCSNILKNLEEHFAEAPDQLFEQLPKDEEGKLSDQSFNELLFGSFLEQCNRFDDISLEKLEEIVTECIRNYNKTTTDPIDFINFDFALEHLERTCRTLSLPCSNLLQIGIAGTGRRTITKVASVICNQKFFNLEMIKDCTAEIWHKSMKDFLKEAGSYGRSCACFIKYDQIMNEEMFQDLYFLLKTGEFPGFYSQDEYNEILNSVRNTLENENSNIDPNENSIFLLYKKRCKKNLHIFLSVNILDHTGDKYLRKYNTIFKYCEVDYYRHWPHEALEKVASCWLEPLPNYALFRAKITKACSYLYYSAIKNTELPIATCSYLGFIYQLVDLMRKEEVYIETTKNKHTKALDKLNYATEQIAEMQNSLANYQPQLELMTSRTTEMTAQIAKETIEVEKVSGLVRKDEEIANQQAAAAAILKLDCEADLAQAIPILEDAISALNTLKPTDITLVKSMKNPPDAIKLVMAAVCVIKEVKPDRIPDPSTGRKTIDYWGPSKRILGDMNFLQTLKDFDKDNIKAEVMVKIRKDYLPHKDFKPQVVAKASSAAEGLCKWIIAMDMYDKVAKEVAPKKEKLEKAESEYAATVAILNEKKEEVARIEEKLADLNLLLKEAKKEQFNLQKNVDICTRKLNKALKLIGGLIEENNNWNNIVKELETQLNCLPGNMLLASAFISYLAPCIKEKRIYISHEWSSYLESQQLLVTKPFIFCNIFAKYFDFHQWFMNDLPEDDYFIENAIISKLTKRFVLFIDPQLQANNWIRQIEKYNEIKIESFFSNKLLENLRECVINGKPILIENLQENLNSHLKKILLTTPIRKDENNFISFDDDKCLVHRKFILYLTTQLRYPKFHPDFYNKITVINFALNREALDNHLVVSASIIERPRLKKIKKDFDEEKSVCQKLIENTATKMLVTLSESRPDILEDEEALKTLEDLKFSLKNLQERAEKNLELQQTLNDFKKIFRPFSKHATTLYLTIYNLIKINQMYRFSFKWFMEMFVESIQNARKSKDMDQRIQNLIYSVTYELYSKVSTSLFDKDKLLFAFLIALDILLARDEITQKEIQYFNKTFSNAVIVPVEYAWISIDSWIKLLNTTDLDRYKNFVDHFKQHAQTYKNIFESPDPTNQSFLKEYSSNFDKLFIINIFKPEYFYRQAKNFVENELGPEFTKFNHFDISASYHESNIQSPLLFLLNSESDPLNTILNFTKLKQMQNRFKMISITEKNHNIENILTKARQEGCWICIQNIHLILPFLNILDLYLDRIDYDNTNEDFRLWLTAKDNFNLPGSLLEKCIKISQDSPKSIKNNLLQFYKEEPLADKEFILTCPGKTNLLIGLTYNLAFLHCWLRQRRSFGSFGWNLHYEFRKDDFLFSLNILQSILNDSEAPLESFSFLIGKCIYGNLIRDCMDHEIFLSILQDAASIGQNFKMCPTYHPPVKTEYQDFLKRIETLPNVDEPQAFYFPKNYQFIPEISDSKLIMNHLEKLHGGNGPKMFNKDDKIKEIFNYLPMEVDTNSISLGIDPIISFVCRREVEMFNRKLSMIKTDLNDLMDVCETLTRSNLEEVLEALENDVTPKTWAKYNESHVSLGLYLRETAEAKLFLESFIKNTTDFICLKYFMNPNCILVAYQLLFCKNLGVDVRNIICELRTNGNRGFPEIKINGLLLRGAGWNIKENCLEELLPGKLYTYLESVFFVFHSIPMSKSYICPLYKNVERLNQESTNWYGRRKIFNVNLQSKEVPKCWKRMGVVLSCK